MHIRFDCLIDLVASAPCSVQATLDVHTDQRHDLTDPGDVSALCLTSGGAIDVSRTDLDGFGNVVRSFEMGPGAYRLCVSGTVFHSGFPDAAEPDARAVSVRAMPAEVRPYLLPSRHCPSDGLADQALALFGAVPSGWRQVHAVCGYVRGKMRHRAAGASAELTHAAMAFCRALNIPVRYCAGYLVDPEAEPMPATSAYHSWFEAFLDGAWWTFDATQAEARIGRVLIARGRDAVDAPAQAVTILKPGTPLEVIRMTARAAEHRGARFPVTAEQRRDHWCTHRAIAAQASGF
jgi:transglutaminase-like putative cysteine protease